MRELITEQAFSEQFWYNALPVGTFFDPRYGRVDITKQLVEGIAKNFLSAPAYPPPVKFGHGDGAASPGVVKEAEARPEGLFIRVEVDDQTAADLKASKYRFMSAEYDPDYMEKTSGKRIGPVLQGVALTNQPAHPGVVPIALSDGKWEQKRKGDEIPMDEKLLKALQDQIAELTTKLSDLAKNNEEMKKQLETTKTLADTSAQEAARLRSEKRALEVKNLTEKWLSEGIPPAVVDKVRPVLLADGGITIRLGDGKDTSVGTLLEGVFADMPRVKLDAKGDPNAKGDDARMSAIKLGDEIAARANRHAAGAKK